MEDNKDKTTGEKYSPYHTGYNYTIYAPVERKDCEAAAIDSPIGVDECGQRYPAFYTVYRHSLFRNGIRDIYIKIHRISALLVEGNRPNEEGKIFSHEGW